MTERQAKRQGLNFTGVYERSYNSDKAKMRAAEIRKEYKCRAVLVTTDGGVSVYADDSYHIRYQAESVKTRLSGIENRKKRAYDKYLEEIKEIEADEAKYQNFLLDNSDILNY